MKAACLLKKRIQLFTADQLTKIKKMMYKQLKEEFSNFTLMPKSNDITEQVANKPVPHADTLVLYSASQRANKGRKRFKIRGKQLLYI